MSSHEQRQGFIDWLKASGMVLILIGHVVGSPDALFNAVSVPVYSKQLGVAFFVFAAGWSLANEQRPALRAAFNRAFPIYLYGLLCALALSGIYWFSKGTINRSNYLPLMGGINVFFNFFPANPTTWYIGMYLHLLLFWLWQGPRRVRGVHLLMALMVELVVRAVFLGLDRAFTGYMLLTNWLTVFLLGQYLNTKKDQHSLPLAGMLVVVWLGLLALWPTLFSTIGFDGSFPTRLPNSGALAGVLLASIMVSMVYIGNTLLAFALFRALPANDLVRFVARNTLLIFILHMPLIYALTGPLYGVISAQWAKVGFTVLLLLFGLGALSELLNRLLPLAGWKDCSWRILERFYSLFWR